MHQPSVTVRRFVLAAAAGLLVGGCAQTPRQPTPSAVKGDVPEAAEQVPPTLLPLARLASRQVAHALGNLARFEPPEGLDAAGLQPDPTKPDPPEARIPLETVIARLAAHDPDPPAAAPPVSPRDAQAAVRLYVSGREKLMHGEAPAAVSDLTKATELDPGSGEPWRELAEAQLAAGWRTDATGSFARALACGLEDPRVVERLGRAAADRGDHPKAAALLARASLASPERSDPMLPAVIDVALSRSLSSLGYTAAARDALHRAVRRSPQLTASTRYYDEYGAIFRRQGELWREAGDASCRLGDYARAAEAYHRAAGLPALDLGQLPLRGAFASVRAGAPAGAALDSLTEIVAQNGRITPDQIAVLAYLGKADRATGAEIAAALERVATGLDRPIPPSIAGGIARARAAVLPAGRAAAVLGQHLAVFPGDVTAQVVLFDNTATPSEAAARAVAMAAARPALGGRLAEALLRSRHDSEAIEESLRRSARSDARGLLLAYAQLLRGFPGKAAATLAEQPDRESPGLALARVEVGYNAGDPVLAKAGMARLAATPGAPRDHARALLWEQRNAEALDLLTPLLAAPNADTELRLEDLLGAADLAMSLGRGEDAQRWLGEAADLDPFDDRVSSRFLRLYSAGGTLADAGKMAGAVRDLRQSNAEGRTIRAARVKELLRRSMLEQAEAEALVVAQEEPGDPAGLELLVSCWRAGAAREGPGALNRARVWLEAQLRRRPGSAALLEGLVVIETDAGKSDALEPRLRAALTEGAGADVSRLLEGLLRGVLGQAQQADALLMARLDRRALLPLEAFELANALVRNGNDSRAAETILTAFPGPVTMLPEQGARLVALASEIAKRGIENPEADRRAAAIRLLDLAQQRAIRFLPELHERRLNLLALCPEADAARILEAATFTATQYPSLGSDPYRLAARSLVQANRAAVALVFLSRAADLLTEPDNDLYFAWFQVAGLAGTSAHGREMIEKLHSANRLKGVLERFTGTPPPGAPPKDERAEAAYVLGILCTNAKRLEQADAAYELALAYDPGHAWACNNLGYSILEREGDLNRASDLLERAHAALPMEASIMDSLGWLRYKQGVLQDEVDGDGTVRRRGAVPLLQSAAATDYGRNNPTILDHLGDALWLDGRAEDAARFWELSERTANQLLVMDDRIRSSPLPPASTPNDAARPPVLSEAQVEEYRGIKERSAGKHRAAAGGEDVRVAPQAGNANPRPVRRPTSSATPGEPGDGGTPD